MSVYTTQFIVFYLFIVRVDTSNRYFPICIYLELMRAIEYNVCLFFQTLQVTTNDFIVRDVDKRRGTSEVWERPELPEGSLPSGRNDVHQPDSNTVPHSPICEYLQKVGRLAFDI